MTIQAELYRKRTQRRRLFWPVLVVAVLMIGTGIIMKLAQPEPRAVSQVAREIHRQTIHGVWIGNIYVKADRTDPKTGEMLNFTAETDTIMLGAERAALRVEPEENAVYFDLRGVVLTSIPRDDDAEPAQVVTLDSHTLGPIPATVSIQSDPAGGTLTQQANEPTTIAGMDFHEIE